MSRTVIIADDLTGANATGVLLAREGFNVATFLDLERYTDEANLDVIAINTNSRAAPMETAYRRVNDATKYFSKEEDIKLYAKRIDSTLRGNIGAEIKAMLDALAEDTVAIVVTSFPSSGRVCIGGHLIVNQIPLEKTDVANDPKTPIKNSKVSTILEGQLDEKMDLIDLETVLKGIDSLKEELARMIDEGNRVIIVDAVTNEDISNIAAAIAGLKINVISVDPGPFTAALTKEYLEQPRVKLGKKLLLAIGSVTKVSRKQLEELRLDRDVFIYKLNAENLLKEETVDMEVEKTVEVLLNSIEDYNIIGMTTSDLNSELLNLKELSIQLNMSSEEISNIISQGLGKIVRKILEQSKGAIGGLFTSGGDITLAVMEELKGAGIEVKDEVLPLAVYGRLVGGDFSNTPIITKGGLIGDEDAIIKCSDYMLTKISTEYLEK